MKKGRSLVLLVTALLCVGTVHAGEMEERLEEARKRLDQAAAELAEAYAEAYAGGGKRKHDRAMLGVLLDDCCERSGVVLSGVTPGGGADQMGLQAGDVLVQIDGVALTGSGNDPLKKLTRYMRDVTPGQTVQVTYRRDGEDVETDITTQAHGQQTMRMLQEKVTRLGKDLGNVRTRVFAPEPPLPPSEQLTFVDVDGDLAGYFGVEDGILVLRGPEGDSAVRAGDIILSIDGDEPDDAGDAYSQLAEIDEDTTMAVLRKGQRQAVTVAPGEFGTPHDQSVRIIRIHKD